MFIKNIFRIFLIMYILIYSLSCKFVDFTKLQVESSISQNNEYFMEDEIKIDFTLEPKKESLKELVVLQRDNMSIDFHLRLEGNRAFIKPVEPWQKGRSYSVEVQGDLKLSAGGSHSVYFFRKFFYGEANKKFSLVKWIEPSEDDKRSPLIFEFNYPVDIPSFSKNFSLNPQITFDFFLEQDGTQILIVPKDAWTKNQRFSWALNQLEDGDGYYLDKTYQGNFLWNIDTDIPCLEEVVPLISSGATEPLVPSQEKRLLFDKQGILLSFSKDMDLNSLKDGIRFEPNISGEILRGPSEKEFLWVPESNWALEEEYRMVISSEVKDLWGIELQREEEIFFSVANEFLQVISITLDELKVPSEINLEGELLTDEVVAEGDVLLTDEVLSNKDLQDFSQLGSLKQIAIKDKGNTIITTILFSQPLCLDSFQNNIHSITMEPFFPVTASFPVLEMISSDGQRGLILHWSGFSPSSSEVKNYYRLKIAGGNSGIQTITGNYLKEDVWLIIQVLQA